MSQNKIKFQSPFLHVLIRRSFFDKLQDNKAIENDIHDKNLQKNSFHHFPPKSTLLHQTFPILQNENDISLLNNKQLQGKAKSTINHSLEKFTKNQDINISIDKKQNSSLLIKQQDFNKIDHTYYVFDQYNSLYPMDVPVKYGFQMRSLIENNHLPLWRFSNQDKNQLIFNLSINQNLPNDTSPSFILPTSSKQTKVSTSNSVMQNSPSLITSHIQRCGINSLLNNSQSEGHNKQLPTTVYQSNHPSSIPIRLVSCNISQYKRQTQQQYEITKRPKCIKFEEYFEEYYLPKWCLTYTSEFKHQKNKY
ncbi:unnamed protein product [Rotaria sp. Silwood2]|nr:unnamed protein product [Rotaria sp. Silwood2]CAF2899029.1 unnamed protein product [Rotaria sp. Silwood2]CAF3884729.1 unnamed protein product [Rotaria sp. Silwood2]CAF4071292.1 unnamed protein product [Rotaria sp. Silwood2]